MSIKVVNKRIKKLQLKHWHIFTKSDILLPVHIREGFFNKVYGTL